MLPDRVSNPGPLTYESGTLPIALRGPTGNVNIKHTRMTSLTSFSRGCYLPSLLRPMLPSVGGFAISSDGYFCMPSWAKNGQRIAE